MIYVEMGQSALKTKQTKTIEHISLQIIFQTLKRHPLVLEMRSN